MHPVVFEERALKTRLYRYLYPFGDLSELVLIIDKNASREQQYRHEQCQYHECSVQKEIFHNSFKPSLPIKPTHCLVEVNTEYQYKKPCTRYIESHVNQQAKDEQDKQQ